MNTESQIQKPLMIGLTGGIASGKSVVARYLESLGAVLIDADQLSREVVAKGTEGLAEIAEVFGRDILTENGDLNRPALGALIFADEQKREALNSIVHPRVRAESARRIAEAPRGSVIVQDIPLLVETGQAKNFDKVLVVQAPLEERIRRMVEDRGMTRDAALSRIEAQASDAERAEVADVVLDNSTTIESLLEQVDDFWNQHVVEYLETSKTRSQGA
ncbi:dephospho-CoA kinase [Neomicrococcus lactis]|uniref:Dephospho-CoA kinase n=1 Tax=Neomicrococcus lactis TaxID=732241 RepID=A0A7W8YAC8_9MICC|nr:dephospho-CoA kinase [Neomicrococcus lactis]MBB5597884.1 dephospho-CoA kinase [Neomicrococcus lactis]